MFSRTACLVFFTTLVFLSPATFGYVLENDAYRVEQTSAGFFVLTAKDSSLAVTFATEFTVMYSSGDPILVTNSSYDNGQKMARMWGAYGNTLDPFAAGTKNVINANAFQLIGGKLVWTFADTGTFGFSAELSLDPGDAEPKISFTVTAKTNGYFSTVYTGAPEENPANIINFPQPANANIKEFDGEFPSEPYIWSEYLSPSYFVLVSTVGKNVAVIVDPDVVPYRLPNMYNPYFGLGMRNEAGNAQPMVFAPEMGVKYNSGEYTSIPADMDSYLSTGQSYDFAIILMVRDGGWNDAYQYIAREIYGFSDQRDNSGPGSMNRVIANMTDYVLDADGGNYNNWDAEQKFNEYFTDQPGAFKPHSALWGISAAIILDDANFYWKRALPQIEYCLSRKAQYFQPYDMDYNTQMTINKEVGYPWLASDELGILYAISQERTPAFRIYGMEKGVSTANSRFLDQLEYYRFTSDANYLQGAIDGAYWTIGDQYHMERFQKFLEIYEETGDANFLAALDTGVRMYSTTLNAAPKVPDGNVVVDLNNEAPIHWHSYGRHVLWGFPPPEPMYAPEQVVPAWRPSCIGLQVETWRGFTFNDYADSLLRASTYTNDDFARDLSRWAMVGRWGNYPGQMFTRAHSLVYEQADYCMHPLQYMTFTSMHFGHPWMHLTFVIEYLVSDAFHRSGGQIVFPRRRMVSSSFPSNIHGFKPGSFYDETGVYLWLPRDLLDISTEQINYIAGYGNDKLYLALSNQSFDPETVTIDIEPNLVDFNSTNAARVWKENIEQSPIVINNGSFTIDVAAKGLTVLAIDGVEAHIGPMQQGLHDSTIPSLSEKSLSRTSQPFGNMIGMIISYGSQLTSAYLYTDAKPYWMDTGNDVSYVTLHYSDGGLWQQETDEIYPFEFTIPLEDDVSEFHFYFDVYKINGTNDVSTTEILEVFPESWTVGSLEFPDVPAKLAIGLTKQIHIRNNTPTDLNFTGNALEISGSDSNDFAFDVSSTTPIPPGNVRIVDVTFDPVSIGIKQAQLNIYTDYPSRPTTIIILNGTGVPSISGYVTDMNRDAVDNVTLQNSSGNSAVTDANGYYLLQITPDSNQVITISKTGFSFTPSQRSVIARYSDIENINWAANSGGLDYFDLFRVIASNWLDDTTYDINGVPTCDATPLGDISEDCKVNFFDFAIIPIPTPPVGLIDPTTLTATANFEYVDRNAIYAVNGAGMVSDAHISSTPVYKMWMGSNSGYPQWIKVDLAASYRMEKMKIYNFNWDGYTARCCKNVQIFYSNAVSDPGNPVNNPGNWVAVGNAFDLTQAPGADDYGTTNPVAPDEVYLTGITARWISIKVNSHYGGSYCGLSEVQFFAQ